MFLNSWLRYIVSVLVVTIGVLTLLSFNMLWAIDLTWSPSPWAGMKYYGYSLLFPSNVLIIISGILALIFSIAGIKLNIKVQGVGTALAGIALIPPIYFVVNLSGLQPELTCAPEQGFFLIVALCIALLTSASFFVGNWKFAPLPPLIALMITLVGRVYSVERVGYTIHLVDYGFPFQWLRHTKSLISKTSFFMFYEGIFLFDVIIWLILAWPLLYTCMYTCLRFSRTKTWKKIKPRITGERLGSS